MFVISVLIYSACYSNRRDAKPGWWLKTRAERGFLTNNCHNQPFNCYIHQLNQVKAAIAALAELAEGQVLS